MMTELQKADRQARNDRLRQVAANIDRSANAKFYGADYHLGFNYLYGEVMELQRKFNEQFGEYIPKDERFTHFYELMVQTLESSEVVLMDSINPAANAKAMREQAGKDNG